MIFEATELEWECIGSTASCLNPACRHTALIDVSKYAAETEVPSFPSRAKCTTCGGRNVDVRPNWLEQPGAQSLTGKQWG
jgi:hypothetical protein